MNRKRNIYKLIILAVIVLLAMAAYMTISLNYIYLFNYLFISS